MSYSDWSLAELLDLWEDLVRSPAPADVKRVVRDEIEARQIRDRG